MGLFDFLKKKSVPSANINVYTPSEDEISENRKERTKQETRNFQKDDAGLYPHEILLLSYYEKYYSGNPIARFWEYEFGVDDVPKLMKSLEDRGFAENGKLTDLGESEIKKSEYIQYMRRHRIPDISLSEMSILVNKHPEMSYIDLLWGELNRLSGEYITNQQFGLYRNMRYTMYRFLMEEKRYKGALYHLAEVLFYDLNGEKFLSIPPGIIEDIRKISRKLDETDEQMIAQLQEGYKDMFAPYQNFSAEEATCIFTAYAFGHDEIAQEILNKHNETAGGRNK